MKIVKTIIMITSVFLVAGCNGFNHTEEVEVYASDEIEDVSPPTEISGLEAFSIKEGEVITILPSDVAKDLDDDSLSFVAVNDEVLQSDSITIRIHDSYIECSMDSDGLVGSTEDFDVYVTDGTYRTKITLTLEITEEKTVSSSDNGIPYAKGDPVKFTVSSDQLYIYPSDLATSKGTLYIESISGTTSIDGNYGTLSYYSSSKALYTVNEGVSSGTDEFVVIVTNGTNSVTVNVQIKID